MCFKPSRPAPIRSAKSARQPACPIPGYRQPAALPWLTGDLGPPERRALREIVERGDLAHAGEQAFLIVPVSPETLDILAAFEAEAEDREDEPVEDQGDDGPSIVSTNWT